MPRTRSKMLLSFVSLLTLISLSVACFYKRPAAQGPSIPNLPTGVALDLPKDLENPDLDAELAKESAIIISIAPGNQLYLGRERVLKEQLGDKLVNLLKSGDGIVRWSCRDKDGLWRRATTSITRLSSMFLIFVVTTLTPSD